MSNNDSYMFYREGVELLVQAPTAILDEIVKHLQLFSSPQERKVSTPYWTVSCGEEAEKRVETEEHIRDILSPLGEPEREYIIFPSSKQIHVTRPKESRWIAQHILRLVRVLTRNQFKKRHLFLHAAMTVVGNKSLAFAGERKSGKTTSLLNLAKNLGGSIISNDDLSIMSESDSVYGYGWPRSISIRLDVIAQLNLDLSRSPALKKSHPANDTNLSASYLHCYPEELSNFLRVPLVTKQPINYFIFPHFGDSTALTHLSRDDVYDRLAKNTLSHVDSYSANIDKFFNEALSKEEIENKLQEVAARIPGYSLEQKFTDLDASISVLKEELRLYE